jgi:23S rRNA (uridine2552-2'-O)-methyltransferase
LRTARGRTTSSQRWLNRQLNDPYVSAAKSEGYRSRAAFKLIQIDQRFRLLKSGMRVVDLGAAPGGWAQVLASKVNSGSRRGKVVAVDINPLEPLPGVDLLQCDFLEIGAEERIKSLLGGLADGVVSDMAAPATGHRQTDHLRIMALAEAAGAFACDILAPRGFFLCKVLQGGTEKSLLNQLKRRFSDVRHIKPEASRSESAELYVLATGFRATP